MNRKDVNDPQLLEWVERYFDGTLSDEQETWLRQRVATTTLRHPAIDEARALMGFRIPARKEQNHGKAVRLVAGIAATIALTVTVGVNVLRSPLQTTDTTCIAYFNGQRITDEEAVLDIMAADLAQFDDASLKMDESFAQVIDSVAPVIEDYQAELPLPEY